jgi:hypothetical protein
MFAFLRRTALWILLTPLALGITGALSNQLVLAVNGDTFPVHVNTVKVVDFTGHDQLPMDDQGHLMLDDTHCVMTSKTHLNFLADWIDMKQDIESPGDILLELGDWTWTFCPFIWGAEVSRRLLSESRES